MFKYKQNEVFRDKNWVFQKSLKSLKSHLFQKATIQTGREKSDYVLYARSLITQLHQELQLNLLTQDKFKHHQQQVFKSLKKCTSTQRSDSLPRLWEIYRQLKVPIQKQYWVYFQQACRFWAKQSSSNQGKIVDAIICNRIDLSIAYFYKNINQISPDTKSDIKKISQNILKLVSILEKKMLKKQYQSLLKSILLCCEQKPFKKSEKKHTLISNAYKYKVPTLSDSSHSITSQPSQSYLKRIALFEQEAKMQNFHHTLMSMAQSKNKRKRQSTRYSGRKSINISKSMKRVSSTWGKNQMNILPSAYSIVNMFSNNHMQHMLVKQSSSQQHCQNVGYSNFDQIQNSEKRICLLQNMHEKQSTSFFTFFNFQGRVRTILFSIIKLVETDKKFDLNLMVTGYFNQKLKLNIQRQQCDRNLNDWYKQMVLSHLYVSKNMLWYKLEKSPNKIYTTAQQSYISRAVNANLRKIGGFIKIGHNNCFAILEPNLFQIYDCGLRNLLAKKVYQFQLRLSLLQNAMCNSENQQDKNDDFRPLYNISVLRSGLKNGYADKKIYQIKQKPIKSAFKQSLSNRKIKNFKCREYQAYEIARTDNNFEFLKLSKQKSGRKIVLASLGLLGSNKLLIKLESSYKYKNQNVQDDKISLQRLKDKFVHINKSQKYRYKMVRFSRRMNQHQFTKVIMQFKFNRFSSKHGFIIFTIFIFHRKDCPLVIIEAYFPLTQKYYQFNLNKQVITGYFQKNMLDFTDYVELRLSLYFFCQDLKTRISQKNKQIQHFTISINKYIIQGYQLLFRRCFVDKNNELQRIQMFSIGQLISLNEQKIVFKRQVFDLSSKLRNYAFQNHELLTSSLFVKFTYLYLEMLTSIKKYSLSLEKKAKNLLFPCKKKQYNEITKINFGHKIMKIQGTNKTDVLILEYEVGSQKPIIYKLSQQFLQNQPLANLLKGNIFLRYISRSLKNKGEKRLMLELVSSPD